MQPKTPFNSRKESRQGSVSRFNFLYPEAAQTHRPPKEENATCVFFCFPLLEGGASAPPLEGLRLCAKSFPGKYSKEK